MSATERTDCRLDDGRVVCPEDVARELPIVLVEIHNPDRRLVALPAFTGWTPWAL
jgi:hypothetical protein